MKKSIEQLEREVTTGDFEALLELGSIGPRAFRAIPAIADVVRKSESGLDRMTGMWVLLQMGRGHADQTVPVLIEVLLQDASAIVRSEAASTLGCLGKTAQRALPALGFALGFDGVEGSACHAIRRIHRDLGQNLQ